ncbi:N-lysine methyltransferase SMYD2-B isoform X2 [Haplochromis burtoni]|uniref:N-lysine methyltransferase SMYD2-B isoform X2 n=1 Tax=Haplochromis burtoni TaxID=8153 RepID=UPI0003BD053F|nr:N-lysine methyltransferase SMYD2-B isoform X2 [Haplochromis burtoni]
MMGSIKGLERFDSPGKGRGLRVSRPFKVGELLFSCPAYSHVLSVKERGCYCEFCFTRTQHLARCGKCKKAFYCNVKCQKGDWAMHKLECSAMVAFGENWCPSEISRLVARILAKKKMQKERCVCEKMLLIGEMQSHTEDEDNEKREMTEADIARLHRFYSKHLDMPDHKELLTLFSQVLISYIDLLYPTDDRNNRLRESYYFLCDCQECKSKSKDKAKLKVRKQSDSIEPDVINNMVRYARKTIREFREFKHTKTPSELLEMCEQSLEEMGAVFDDSNVYMLHMMYQAMGICMYMQDLDGAIRYGEKLLKPYSHLYPPYSLNVSSVYLKLGRLYLGLERESACTSALKKAMAIMEVAHGKDHFYIEELRKMIAQK